MDRMLLREKAADGKKKKTDSRLDTNSAPKTTTESRLDTNPKSTPKATKNKYILGTQADEESINRKVPTVISKSERKSIPSLTDSSYSDNSSSSNTAVHDKNTSNMLEAKEEKLLLDKNKNSNADGEKIAFIDERSRGKPSTPSALRNLHRQMSVKFDISSFQENTSMSENGNKLPVERIRSFSSRKSSLDSSISSHDNRNLNEFSKTFQRYMKKKKSYSRRGVSLDTSTHSLVNYVNELQEESENSQRGHSFLHKFDESMDHVSLESTESPHLILLRDAKAILKSTWNIDFEEYNFSIGTPSTQVKIQEKKDAVLIMESWNKVLAFRSMFAEALMGRWRILAAADQISDRNDERRTDFEQQFWVQNIIETDNAFVTNTRRLENEALRLVEMNLDPLALHFGERVADIGLILVSMIDMAVRSLCPHAQYVQREAYREMKGSADEDIDVSGLFFHEKECTNFEGFCKLFSSYGIKPENWLLLCDAFLWAMKNQNPYSLDHEKDDAITGGAHGKFISGMVVLPLIEAFGRRSIYIEEHVFTDLKECITLEDVAIEDNIQLVAAAAFSKLFTKLPYIEDHFSNVDIEEMSYYIFEVIILMAKKPADINDPSSEIRQTFNRISTKWNDLNLTVEALLLLGKEIIAGASSTLLDSDVFLTQSFSYLWKECLKVGILYPITVNHKLRKDAERFIDDVAAELKWTYETKRKRLFNVRTEISATGTYTHTPEELEIGARLAWRNSSKCVGRISWNTLKVRDCRNIGDNPRKVFDECVEHLKIATGGTNIQSVMTVFRPQAKNEIFGMRFWSSQFVRYAGYVNENTGDIIGDPANVNITKLLIEKDLWIPPTKKTAFDVLPLVLKLPKNDHPFVYELPKDVVHEVNIEHPDYPHLKDLGLKWAAVPAITNFMMNLGGIKYPCAPFNGWFLSTEVVRNLIERYDVTKLLAPIFGINLDDKLVKMRVSTELELAVLHSFEKERFTVVDPVSVGESFLTHCKRERESGRECPAQWSWIGGLLGPTNPTWHLEMRDFKACPQYDYCCDPSKLTNLEGFDNKKNNVEEEQTQSRLIVTRSKTVLVPKVLIAFGSETGTAEQCASSLAKRLKLCSPTLCPLNEVIAIDPGTRDSFDFMLIICSTFGQGAPPSNALHFFERFHELSFNGIKFAVLALGSSLYPDFCKAGQDIVHKMVDVGAKSVCEIVKVDSSLGNQGTILEWSTQICDQILPEKLVNEIKMQNQNEGKDTSPLEYSIVWLSDESTSLSRNQGTMKCTSNTELCRESHDHVKSNVSEKSEIDFLDRPMSNKLLPSVRHIEMECEEIIDYTSGDHLAVSPLNSLSKVIRFCKCFELELTEAMKKSKHLRSKLELSSTDMYTQKARKYDCDSSSLFWLIEQKFSIHCKENGKTSPFQSKILNKTTLRLALQRSLDFSFHTATYVKDFLTMVAAKLDKALQEDGIDPSFDNLLHQFEEDVDVLISDSTKAQGNDTAMQRFKDRYPTIVDFLEEYIDIFCKPIYLSNEKHNRRRTPIISIADVLVLMPHMKDRFYSISSSDVLSPNKLSITVRLFQRETSEGVIEKGTCSSYLKNLSPGTYFDARIVKSSFRCPSNPTFPVVLIGGGTGIAPFMAFMEERAAEFDTYAKYARWHFYYGCRTKSEFLYKDKIEKWTKSGVITSHIAYSRETDEPKTYVQDLLEEDVENVVELLLCKNTHVMICGNASMASICRQTIISLLRSHGHMSTISAEHLLSTMSLKKRWQLDVWGKIEEQNRFAQLRRASVQQRELLAHASKSQRNFLVNF